MFGKHSPWDDLTLAPSRGIRSLGRSIGLAATVGFAAGLGAVLFHVMCATVVRFATDEFVGFRPGGPAGEHAIYPPSTTPFQPWMILPVITLGAMISGWIVYTFAPEAEGHGTDAAIDAYHNKRGIVRLRVSIVKMVTSAITLGTGGSGGREGPIAQIGAGFGSYLATRMGLSDQERRSLMAAGLGAGIGAIFHAPLAGSMFAVEVLYRDPDFEAENLIPAFIATTISYTVFMLFFPGHAFAPLFDHALNLSVYAQSEDFVRPMLLLLPLAVLALAMSGASFVYVRCFYGIHALFAKLPGPRVLRPMLGGFLTGLFAIVLYYIVRWTMPAHERDVLSVLAFGYGFLQRLLTGEIFAGDSNYLALAAILLIVGFGKILSTSLTIGSGGSGGVFGPSMVIGGSLGAFVGLLFHRWMPGIVGENDIVVFAILGMAGFFAAAANTPVSTLLMVSEMCSSYILLLPSMWVCALAYMVSRKWSLYTEQVGSRLDSPAHRGDFIVDVMQGMTVRDAMRLVNKDFVTVARDTPLGSMTPLLTDTRQTSFPVLDDDGHYFGVFSLNDIRQYLYDSPVADLAVAQDLAVTEAPLTLQMDLSSAISRFADGAFAELPVVDEREPGTVVGLLRRQDVIATYSARLLEMRRG